MTERIWTKTKLNVFGDWLGSIDMTLNFEFVCLNYLTIGGNEMV